MEIFLQQLVNGITLGSIYALVALGYTMVYGIIGLINFAHGEVVMIGALTAFSIISGLFAIHAPLSPAGLMIAGLLVAAPVCMTIGFLIERVAYRPLRRAPRLAALITAIGVSIVLQNLGMIVWGRNYLHLPQILSAAPHRFSGVSITDLQAVIIGLAICLMAGLLLLIHRTRLGVAMRATAENAEVAGLMGINVNTVISLAFVLGSGLASVAGLMVLSYYGIGHYYMGFLLGLKAFTAAVLGGIGNLSGAMAGGLLLGIIEALGAGYIGDISNLCPLSGLSSAIKQQCIDNAGQLSLFGSNYKDVFAFFVLILVLTLRPSGLLGERVGDRA